MTNININLYLDICTKRVIQTIAKADSLKIILGLNQYGNIFTLSNEVHDKTSVWFFTKPRTEICNDLFQSFVKFVLLNEDDQLWIIGVILDLKTSGIRTVVFIVLLKYLSFKICYRK